MSEIAMMLFQITDECLDAAVPSVLIGIPGRVIENKVSNSQHHPKLQQDRSQESFSIVTVKSVDAVLS
jgi:hypothetical protein